MKPPLTEGYVFDLDGTVYLGERLIPGADRVINGLRDRGCRLAFLSNKPIDQRENYAKKLTKLGIPVSTDQVINSSYAAAQWLSSTAPGCRVYVIGEHVLKRELANAGIVVVDDSYEVDFVVASFDRTFDYRKLYHAMISIKNGARFIATNPDRTCPVEGGELPDCAAVIGAIQGATGIGIEAVMGKPSEVMLKTALEMLELPPEKCTMVGDRLETDIAMGKKAGMLSLLVLTGASTRDDIVRLGITPDYICDGIWQLV